MAKFNNLPTHFQIGIVRVILYSTSRESPNHFKSYQQNVEDKSEEI